MNKYSTAEIEELVSRFSEKTLPKEKWTHQAHIVIALWHNFYHEFEDALDLVRSRIKTYNISIGTLNNENSGYHETLTMFWMILISNFLRENISMNLQDACTHFFKSEMASKNTPLRYYTKELLFSKQARKRWVNGNLKRIILLKEEP